MGTEVFPFIGTVSVSDPPCKDGNAWLSMVPLKALSDQAWIRYQCLRLKTNYFQLWFLYKSDLHISTTGKPIEIIG